MSSFAKLIDGYRTFKGTTFARQKDIVMHLMQIGTKPTTLVIACSDMRISPEMLTSATPGDLYVVRNICGLVPPFDSQGAHGVIAAIEYAVCTLEVENIIVLGHAECDGIKLLLSHQHDTAASDATNQWLSIANTAKEAVENSMKDKSSAEQEHACQQETILVSLKNLIAYPWVSERVEADKLSLYGWHFDIKTGELLSFDPESLQFESLD